MDATDLQEEEFVNSRAMSQKKKILNLICSRTSSQDKSFGNQFETLKNCHFPFTDLFHTSIAH